MRSTLNQIMKIIRFTLTRTICLPIVLSFLLTSCEGPSGPPGIDAEGVDVTSPTIALVSPHPLDDVWDKFDLIAAAVDNVAIREVVFTVDGSQVVNGVLLLVDEAPYEVEIDMFGEGNVRLFEPGWHYVAARAYDDAGNVTDSPLVPVRFGYSEDLRDTVDFKYHNGEPIRAWVLPDTASTIAYWSRFHTPDKSQLIAVNLFLGGALSDSSECYLKIMEGDFFPDDQVFLDTLTTDLISVEPSWLSVEFPDTSIKVDGDFFVVISLPNPGLEDSLVIMSDDGLPPWQRCGNRDERGYYLLSERYGANNNLMIDCKLYYTPPDTGQAIREKP